MPLTEFQKGVARTIAANRKPESHIAGGAVLNRGDSGLRISDDLDIFHDRMEDDRTTAEFVAASAEADANLLRASGYSVEWKLKQGGFYRAVVSRDDEHIRLDWANDATYRFFPVQPDEEFGYCLHRADLATNKAIALALRSEIRDLLDILELDQHYLSLGAIIWAACAKDQGFTPEFMLNEMNRNSVFRESDLKGERLTRQVDLKGLKIQWIEARDRARNLFDQLPPEEIGCLYLDPDNRPVTPDPSSPDFPKLSRHFGSVRGAWPRIS